MIKLIIEAFILGLIGGAVPGPILTGTFAEILNSGFLKGLRVVFYAFIIETLGALATIYIIYSLGLPSLVIKIISICGALVLFWLGWNVWRINQFSTEKKEVLSFSKIVILTALNSGYWIFWFTIGVPRALILNNVIFGGKFIFLIIFEIAWLVMTIGLAFIFSQFRAILYKKNLVGATFKFLAIILIILGVKTLINIY